MRSDSYASYRSAAPQELFGEPDDSPPEQPRCRTCGAFASWHPSREGRAEVGGLVMEYADWTCKRCGNLRDSTEWVVGAVYGPLPYVSDLPF